MPAPGDGAEVLAGGISLRAEHLFAAFGTPRLCSCMRAHDGYTSCPTRGLARRLVCKSVYVRVDVEGVTRRTRPARHGGGSRSLHRCVGRYTLWGGDGPGVVRLQAWRPRLFDRVSATAISHRTRRNRRASDDAFGHVGAHNTSRLRDLPGSSRPCARSPDLPAPGQLRRQPPGRLRCRLDCLPATPG
jgi:hypothetical protein